MMNGMGFGMGFGWILWILVIVLVVWGVKTVMESQGASSGSSSKIDGDGGTNGASEMSALDILKQRYARGEIDSKEYEDMREKLAR